MMEADLHCHSTCSDGSASPELLVRYALRLGLTVLALTDHDTMAGTTRLRAAAGGTPLRIIPSVECTTKDPANGRSVHILCYAPQKPALLEPLLKETSARRRRAKLDMIEKLKKLYPVLDVEDVLELSSESASIFESHIMTALANAGVTNQPYGPLLDELIGKHGTCHTPIAYPGTLEVIDLMHEAGGFVVIAHPGQFDSVELTLRLAAERRIEGIECYHYRNSPTVIQQCLDAAQRWGLAVTGGSDFHGMNTKTPHPLGYRRVSGERCKAFLDALGGYS
jgi:hypothetical protein